MLATSGRPTADKDLLRYVGDLSASWQTSGRLLERRDGHRVRYSALLRLEPLDDNGNPLAAAAGTAPLLVQCRDISQQGISFRHAQPLPFRTVALTFLHAVDFPTGSLKDDLDDLRLLGAEPEIAQPVRLITRLRWCRFTAAAVYESGGYFLSVKAGSQDTGK